MKEETADTLIALPVALIFGLCLGVAVAVYVPYVLVKEALS